MRAGKRAAMKIAGARVENKRLAPSLAIFMLGGAPKAHEVLPEKWNRAENQLSGHATDRESQRCRGACLTRADVRSA